MAEKHQVYQCESCGNIVEILHAGEPQRLQQLMSR